MPETLSAWGKTEAIIIVKAAPQVGLRHGETVCCAGIDLYGNWVRLYPVSFRHLEQRQKFARWDRVQFSWRRPNDDRRPESRRVDQGSIEIVGALPASEKASFLGNSVVTSLQRERERGRSLALIRPEIIEFSYERKKQEQIDEEQSKFAILRNQTDLFSKEVTPYSPCPYAFRYHYRIDDGDRFGTCQDWEVEGTFYRLSREYGEDHALRHIERVFGDEYPKKGMVLAMGTHSRYPDTWLINGIVRLDRVIQTSLF